MPLASEQVRSDAEQRGMLDLIAIRLRAVRGLSLRIDPAGCASKPASHALRVVRRSTESSDITAIELLDCATGQSRQETFVRQLSTPRDWSHAVAWWVAGELGRQAPAPRAGAATAAPTMAAYLAAIGHLQQRSADSIRRARERVGHIAKRAVRKFQYQFQDRIAPVLRRIHDDRSDQQIELLVPVIR